MSVAPFLTLFGPCSVLAQIALCWFQAKCPILPSHTNLCSCFDKTRSGLDRLTHGGRIQPEPEACSEFYPDLTQRCASPRQSYIITTVLVACATAKRSTNNLGFEMHSLQTHSLM